MAVIHGLLGGTRRVVLPAAPIPGDVIEVIGEPWVVTDRKFVVPQDGESEVILRVERAGADRGLPLRDVEILGHFQRETA